MSEQQRVNELIEKLEQLRNITEQKEILLKQALTVIDEEFDNIFEPSSVITNIRSGLKRVIKSI